MSGRIPNNMSPGAHLWDKNRGGIKCLPFSSTDCPNFEKIRHIWTRYTSWEIWPICDFSWLLIAEPIGNEAGEKRIEEQVFPDLPFVGTSGLLSVGFSSHSHPNCEAKQWEGSRQHGLRWQHLAQTTTTKTWFWQITAKAGIHVKIEEKATFTQDFGVSSQTGLGG